ncbi:MAG: hypothetical protein K1V90_02650 [Muribaculaceae bacterium]
MERVLLYIFIAMTLITQASCKTESELISSNDPLAEYLAFGNIHNSMLEKTQEAIEARSTKGEEFNLEDWKELHELQKEQVQYMDISDSQKVLFTNALDSHFEYYNIDNIWEKSYSSSSDNNKCEIISLINSLHASSIIDSFERDLLKKLSEYIIRQKNEPQFAILLAIEGLAAQWRNHYGIQLITKKGKFSAYIIGISLSSAQWWEDNPESAAPQTRVAPWVYIDALGAIRSACYSAIQQQISSQMSGNVDWEQIAYSALAGDVIYSTTGLKQVAAIAATILSEIFG